MKKAKVIKKSKAVSIDQLALMVANGFQDVGGKIDLLEKKFLSRINGLENRIDDLALNRVKYEDFIPLKTRVAKMEHGIKM